MKIHFFGTGSAIPNQERFRSSLAIEAADGSFLLPDCGELVSTGFIRLGAAPDAVRAVSVTHLHPDHIAGLPLVLQHFQLRNRTLPLTVFLPQEGIAAVKDFLKAIYLGPEMLKFQTDFRPIQPGKTEIAENFTLNFFPNDHLQHHAKVRQQAGDMVSGESYSLLLSDGEKKLLYSGDIAHISELRPLLTPDLDALLLEYAHIPAEDIPAFAALKDLPANVILTHFHPRFPADTPPPVPGWKCAVDGMKFVL